MLESQILIGRQARQMMIQYVSYQSIMPIAPRARPLFSSSLVGAAPALILRCLRPRRVLMTGARAIIVCRRSGQWRTSAIVFYVQPDERICHVIRKLPIYPEAAAPTRDTFGAARNSSVGRPCILQPVGHQHPIGTGAAYRTPI